MRVTILAATGQVGRTLATDLAAAGHQVVAVGRDARRLAQLPGGVVTRIADFDDPGALVRALGDAEYVACCGHAQYLPQILAALPRDGRVRRVVAMGSTRVFSAIPDPTADAVRVGIAALADQAIPAVMLLSTMIYGGGIGVVDGLAARLRRWPIVPVPTGEIRVQPIHVADVAACLAAALDRDGAPGTPIVIAGPTAIRYDAMVRAIRGGLAPAGRILPIPAPVWRFAALVLRRLPGLRGIGDAVGRLIEDRPVDCGPMRARLAISPRAFQPCISVVKFAKNV